MSIPLDTLIDNGQNVYELTCVAIKEASIYSSTDVKDEIEKNGEKVVSYVLEKALNGEIKYGKDE